MVNKKLGKIRKFLRAHAGAHMQSEIGNLIFLRLFSPYIILKVLIVCILLGPTDVLKLAYARTLMNRAADLTPFISELGSVFTWVLCLPYMSKERL